MRGENYTTREVGTKKTNALGIFDMSGNVFERCWDRFDIKYESAKTAVTTLDPRGAATDSSRVSRGGGTGTEGGCTVTYRSSYSRTSRTSGYGFRVVCRQ